MREKGRSCTVNESLMGNCGHHGHFHLTYWPQEATWPKPKSGAGANSSLLAGGAAGEEGRGGVRAHTALLLGAWPWSWGTLGTRTLVALLAQGWRWEAHSWSQAHSRSRFAGPWVVRARRDRGRPRFFSLPSEGRQGLAVSPAEVRGQRSQGHSSDPEPRGDQTPDLSRVGPFRATTLWDPICRDLRPSTPQEPIHGRGVRKA